MTPVGGGALRVNALGSLAQDDIFIEIERRTLQSHLSESLTQVIVANCQRIESPLKNDLVLNLLCLIFTPRRRLRRAPLPPRHKEEAEMNKFRSGAALILGVGLVVTLGQAEAQGPPNGLNVNVLNTPLPVTGSLGVSGTVNAAQSGTWTVNAAQSGAWSFFLNNNATNPVPVRNVENPARQAFTNGANCNLAAGQEICNLFFSVPASKRLVIETVTVTVVVPAGQSPLVTFSALVNGTGEAFRLAVTHQGTFSGDDVFVGTHSTRFYADSGNSAVQGGVLRNGTAGTGQLQVRVSGYLVDCGAGSGCPIP